MATGEVGRVEFRVLGPLEVWLDGRQVPVRRPKERLLLTLLLLRANEVVSRDSLLEALWEGQPPQTATTALQGVVSQLRKRVGGDRVVTRSPGYLLRVADGDLDLVRFVRVAAKARATHDPAGRSECFEQALGLWRGFALDEFAGNSALIGERERLAELRLGVLEDRLDADLELGRSPAVVAELEQLVTANPYRERLRAQLMLALYRCGRQAEALEAYRRGREALVEELGIEPGPGLRALEQQILVQDESLLLKPPPTGPVAPRPTTSGTGVRGVMRKTVTVLFCDIVGSTPLGDQLDPEVLRALLARHFETARMVLERHGGTVEKFIGDAVMAVFGLPELHEDDALRAVRAAHDLRAAVAALNDELADDGGARITIRIGVNTGEVAAGEGATLVTGDAVNLAARLEQAAAPGEILLGAPTHRLVRDLVVDEPVEPLRLRGKHDAVAAFRLLALLPDATGLGKTSGPPFVGRSRELEALQTAYRRVCEGRSVELVAVTGVAGVGKSRLLREFTPLVEREARVATGRCPSYGEGSTYWPLREIVQQLAGDDPRDGLAAALGDDRRAADAIAGAIGIGSGRAQASEVSWAVRRLLEGLADEGPGPLVLVVEDLHWAEAAFLDLMDYLLAFVRGRSLLVLGSGRPELLEARPAWREFALRLEPLEPAAAEALAEHVGSDRSTRMRAVELAEGNPLFLQQLLAGGDDLAGIVPPTIEALLASRIDRLDPHDRTVALCAAVAGRRFQRSAATALVPPELRDDITSRLLALVRKEILCPDDDDLVDDESYRFAHALVREAAYAASSKELRAALHERHAEWLEHNTRIGALEFEELLGHHLAEAYRLRTELGRLDDRVRALGARAARLLGDTGRRALGRGDFTAARHLLKRATEATTRDDPERSRYVLDLAEALVHTGDVPQALERAGEELETAQGTGDLTAVARAEIVRTFVAAFIGEQPAAEAKAVAARAIDVLTPTADDYFLARAWQVIGQSLTIERQHAAVVEAMGHALQHAHRAGDDRLQGIATIWLSHALAVGPEPAGLALERYDALRARVETPLQGANLEFGYAYLLGQIGRFDEARSRMAQARRFIRELGDEMTYAANGWAAGLIELWAGDSDAAGDLLDDACTTLRAVGDRGFLCTTTAVLAEARCRQGRLDEAEQLTRESEETGSSDDYVNEIWWRIARAGVLSRRGLHHEAEQLAREAAAVATASDSPLDKAEPCLRLAETLHRAGRTREAGVAATEAARYFEQKGAVARSTMALDLARQETTV
jgi:class 3 adenylate cyclase